MPIQVPSWVPGWFVSGGSANLPHCWNKFSPTRSKGCPFRFQVGFQVGLFRAALQTYYTVEINFHLPGPRSAHSGSKLGSRLYHTVSGGSANVPHCWNKFSPTRSKGCPFRFQVGFQVGLFRAALQTYHTVEINFHLPGPRVAHSGSKLGSRLALRVPSLSCFRFPPTRARALAKNDAHPDSLHWDQPGGTAMGRHNG